jgi:DNA-binding HxlR family transcriptional regulator
MGFQRGAISLSSLRDIPLLLQVLHSQFIMYDQLFEFMQRRNLETTRAPFNWRVRRLVKSELVDRHAVPSVTSSPIYSLTTAGRVMLAEHCPVLDGRRHKDAATHVKLVHSLELNGLPRKRKTTHESEA